MSESTDVRSTWGQAFQLWFWANVGSFIGFSVSLNLEAALARANHSPGSGPWFVAALVSLYAAVPSLVTIPLTYVAFKWLLQISDYWPRLLTAAAAITGVVVLVMFLAGTSVTEDEEYLLLNLLKMLGWTYWVAALGAAALVYRQDLFRLSEPAKH